MVAITAAQMIVKPVVRNEKRLLGTRLTGSPLPERASAFRGPAVGAPRRGGWAMHWARYGRLGHRSVSTPSLILAATSPCSRDAYGGADLRLMR